ncbi:VCBS repeat-containing protein [Rhodocaloribacter litoris]|uniref:FG-GAP repeat domain-containing protein n=1 Tax=Rhodocaloribacter litoris TaxID=2558931 RepID=UPI001423FA9B|nr:VCBS repeat-containing protein [Rhodocaloribacter litoris]QXD15615.1 VCBS repeat-containing protein [Rhodocaloribacter litoris]
MRSATTLTLLFLLIGLTQTQAQSLEYIFSPERTGELTDPFAVGAQNGARGLSGPWDLDRDGKIEILVAQHNSAGGRIHVIENNGFDTWELVYSTAMIDSSASSSNARYATAADLDGDGNLEIVYVAGTDYSDANPNLLNGVYVWEHDGVVGSDNYGTLPATIGAFFELDGLDDGFVRAQNLEATDIDGDGIQELLVPADGDSNHDIFYVLSVNGSFETNGVGTGFETWVIEARLGPRENGNAFGGGSPYDLIAADLNGDGQMDLSFHSWNFMNFFNATVPGADTIVLPDLSADKRFLQASAPDDHVALFGGIAYDIDADGNSELFYPNWFTKNITVIDYNSGDDVLQIDASKVAFDVIPINGAGGIAVGDIDGDQNMELIVGGNGYQADDWNEGRPSQFISIAEYLGGDHAN